jgi:hypothetical protein
VEKFDTYMFTLAGDFRDLYLNDNYTKILNYCPISLGECPKPPAGEAKFCYVKGSGVSLQTGQEQTSYSLAVNEEDRCDPEVSRCAGDRPPAWCSQCRCVNSVGCSTIFRALNDMWSYCCGGESELKNVGITITDACKYLNDSVKGCILAIMAQQQGKQIEFWQFSELTRRFMNNMKYCNKGFNIKEVKENIESYILRQSKLPKWYLDTLKLQIKNVKKFYETKDKCSQ